MRRTAPLIVLALLFLAGCAQRITPPASVSDPVTVFVLDYGQHASLALPDDGGGLLVEWAWGDWNWFAMKETGIGDGLEALFASRGSTLSRRELLPAPEAAELRDRLGVDNVIPLLVERSRSAMLLQKLEQRWARRSDEAITYPSGRQFVPDDGQYSLSNNSVHELTRWLEALGAEVSGGGFTANYELKRK